MKEKERIAELEKELTDVQRGLCGTTNELGMAWDKIERLEALNRMLLKDNERLVDRSNMLQCLEEAGIDNVEAYSQGMMIYNEEKSI
jgi:hypothetical protein